MPRIHAELARNCRTLEKHYRDVQDVEFTIERGKLWMLQTRDAKRTAQAAVRIAVDLAGERLITRAEAVERVSPDHVDAFLHPQFDAEGQGGREEARRPPRHRPQRLAGRGRAASSPSTPTSPSSGA